MPLFTKKTAIPVIRVWHKHCHSTPVDELYPIVEIKGSYGVTLRELLEAHKQGIILLEHDVRITSDAIKKMLDYHYSHDREMPLVYPYPIYPITTGLTEPVIVHRVNQQFITMPQQPIIVNQWGLGAAYIPHVLKMYIQDYWDYPKLDMYLSRCIDAICLPYYLLDHEHKGYTA